MIPCSEYTPTIEETLYAKAIGLQILTYAKESNQHQLARQVECDAIRLLREIQEILNDTTLDDKNCFYRIDAIVCAFQENGLFTNRHLEL